MAYKIGDKVWTKLGDQEISCTVVEMFPDSPSVKAVRYDHDGSIHTFRPGNRHIYIKDTTAPSTAFAVGDKVYFKEPRKVRSRYLEGVIVSISGKYATISGQNHAFTIRDMATIYRTIEEARKAK